MKRILLASVFVTAVALSLVSCASLYNKASVKPESDRKMAPDFTLKDVAGEPVKLSELRGNVVLVNFWATWCGPCRIEIPWFVGFQQEFKDRKFVVLGISLDEDGWTSVTPFVKEHKINYRTLIGTEQLSQLYNCETLPTTVMIDRSGRIASIHRQLMSKATYRDEILKLLEAPKDDSEHSELRAPILFPSLRTR